MVFIKDDYTANKYNINIMFMDFIIEFIYIILHG